MNLEVPHTTSTCGDVSRMTSEPVKPPNLPKSLASILALFTSLSLLTSLSGITSDFCAWDRAVATFALDMPISRLTLHPSLPHMLVADDTNVIDVWDWEKRKRLAVFSNANPVGSVVTALRFINEEDEDGMVLTGSS